MQPEGLWRELFATAEDGDNYPENSASSRTMLMRDCCAVMMLSSSSMLGRPSFHRSFRDCTATSRVPSSFSSSVCCSAPGKGQQYHHHTELW